MNPMDRRRFLAAGAAALALSSNLAPKRVLAKELVRPVPIPDEPVMLEDWRALREITGIHWGRDESARMVGGGKR